MANKLQYEIKQSSPFSSLEEEAILNLERTADRVQSTFRQMLKPHGLTPHSTTPCAYFAVQVPAV